MSTSASIRSLATCACAALAAGALVLGLGTGTVSAPEPADLTASLSGSTGATAAAVYSNTFVPTRVLLWPATWTAGGTAAAGTPCSTYGLPVGSRATKTIQLSASGLRKCA